MARGRVKTHFDCQFSFLSGKKKKKKLYTVKNNEVQSQNSTDCCNMKHSPIPPAEYKIHNVNDIATLTSF